MERFKYQVIMLIQFNKRLEEDIGLMQYKTIEYIIYTIQTLLKIKYARDFKRKQLKVKLLKESLI